jgi:hypothetical protein
VKKKRCSFEGCANHVVKGGVCITHGATVKRCSFEDCNNHAKKGGFCKRHYSERINAINNPSHRAINELPPILPCQSINDYADEEELNSWIWKSNAHARMAFQKKQLNSCSLHLYSPTPYSYK